MKWWLQNNLRMIQNNIRDIDAGMDIDYEVKMLRNFGANVLQIGCGGITSFYPTKLDCQTPSPYLDGRDFFGKLLEKCHQNDIRVIARFDFSKTHQRLYEEHPDWYVKSVTGMPIRYHDTVATCVNGPYQQEKSLDILREVLERYPVDGVFFNMFGYQTRDYSGNYTGICQCRHCQSRFREAYGKELPTVEDESDPIFQLYQRFKEETVGDILRRIQELVRSINPDVAVSTYHHQGVDIIRNESNSAVDRPYPFWIYASSENVSAVTGTFADKISSNVAINAVDIPYRFMGVSKYLNQIRLYGNIAGGGGLDWCIIGSFEDYPDRENFETTREVFQFHKHNEQYFRHMQSQAKILLVHPNAFYQSGFSPEFRGIFKMLKEDHRLFRVVERFALEEFAGKLDDYELILLPGIPKTECPAFNRALSATTAKVIATGMSLAEEPEDLAAIFGVSLGGILEPVRGSYLETTPKEVFHSFPLRDWVYLDMPFRYLLPEEGVEGLLPLIAPARYGPPERCFGHEKHVQSAISLKDGRCAYLPWMPGCLYYQHGFEDFKQILLDLMDHIAPKANLIHTNAPGCVELFFDQVGEHQYLLQLLNLSGCNGTTVTAHLPIYDLEVTLPLPAGFEARSLTMQTLSIGETDGRTSLQLLCLELYEAIVLTIQN